MFKTWNKIVSEHEELDKMIKIFETTRKAWMYKASNEKCPLLTQERNLREQLPTCTRKEREIIEEKIDSIIDELKSINTALNELHKVERKELDAIYDYMRKNLTARELKKAKKHGWWEI